MDDPRLSSQKHMKNELAKNEMARANIGRAHQYPNDKTGGKKLAQDVLRGVDREYGQVLHGDPERPRPMVIEKIYEDEPELNR